MEPLLGSLLGLTFVFVAVAGVLAMLESWGNPKSFFSEKTLTITHRVLGYLFTILYFFILYFMLKRIVDSPEPLNPLQTIHAVLGVMILPLLLVKILIVRRFKGLSKFLPFFGISIFVLAVSINFITAGFFILRTTLKPDRFISLASYDRSKLSLGVGRKLLEVRCQKCHTLERVFTSVKTEEQWTKTVNQMVLRDPTIEDNEAAQIIFYLSNSRSVLATERGMVVAGMALTDQKCGRCHMLERVYLKKRTKDQWSGIVDLMAAIEPAWISKEEAGTIKQYLYAAHSAEEVRIFRPAVLKEEPTMPPAALPVPSEDYFLTTCAVCHTPDRIYRKAEMLKGNRGKWRTLVEEMIENGAVLDAREKEMILNYLVRLKPATQ